MDWEAIGAVGELLGALAVLVTLGYLAVQVRQNTRTMEDGHKFARAQAHQARTDTAIRVVEHQKPELLAALGARGVMDLDVAAIEGLGPEQRAMLNQAMYVLMLAAENVVYQSELGMLDANEVRLETLKKALPIWRALGTPLPAVIQRVLEREGLLE
ncbi:MAG TPA: hypothetical protein VLA56_14960 [Pseudomonadales bacterium]|nr:hypothetical protein [Pseudomonadales bacterium]